MCENVKMILKKLFVLVMAFCLTSAQQMTCTYSINTNYDNDPYQCTLNVNNPDGLDDSVSIGGDHLGTYMDPYGNMMSTYNDSSVQILTVNGITKNIPSVICKQFPNVEILNCYNSNLQIVSATKCSKLQELRFSYNLIEEVYVDLCQYQPALKKIFINNNKLRVISDVTLKSCKNIISFGVDNNRISVLPLTLFANTPNIQTISFPNNPISAIPNGIFNGLAELKEVVMRDLLLTDLPLNIFPAANKLTFLTIANNSFSQYRPEWFQNLKNLTILMIDYNKILIPANFFQSMPLLQEVYMGYCNISVVNPQWFSPLTSLTLLRLIGNNIDEIPDNTFVNTKALKSLDIDYNKLKTIRSKWFSNAILQELEFLALRENQISAIDPLFFELSTKLNRFSFYGNKCYTGPQIIDFLTKRSTYMPGFQACIDNYAAIQN
ncbi:carboxypeptidase N subunit 2-like [Bradysia coprophila]|uniref:carboxypeptidase N subunit 2-like n=1 Tax=Bradysia coprophila TaxID=38358 RepID=UPI00187D750E|nr:carboxypeptidase N subunit 2-like [Bradysia coprophila]